MKLKPAREFPRLCAAKLFGAEYAYAARQVQVETASPPLVTAAKSASADESSAVITPVN
jgi:hypothetical protein